MKKIFVLVIALVAILSSCSNPASSDVVNDNQPTATTPTAEETRIMDYSPANNKTVAVDFNEDLSEYSPVRSEYRDSETGNRVTNAVNWVYISKHSWEEYYEGKQDGKDYYLKPILKVESNPNGFVFFYQEGREGGYNKRLPIIEDEWAYKCIIYYKRSNRTSNGANFGSAPWYYKYRNSFNGSDAYILNIVVASVQWRTDTLIATAKKLPF